MKKIKKYVYPLSLLLLVSMAWARVLDGSGSDAAVCAEYVKNARINEEKQAYITAAGYYARAAEYDPENTELLIHAAENFLRCGENSRFINYCNTAAEKDTDSDVPWLMLGEYYLERGEADKTAELLRNMPEGAKSDKIYDLVSRAECSFRKGYRTFSDAMPFHGEYCAVRDRDFWGLMDEEGRYVIVPEYDDIGAYNPDEDIVPVSENGIWKFINSDSQVKYVPSEKYTYLGSYDAGLAPFCCDGEYGYTDLEYHEKPERYEYAGAFSDGTAAVKKNGRWALVDSELRCLTEYEFDDITLDRYGFCSHSGIICAVKDGKTVFLNSDGKENGSGKAFSCGLRPVKTGKSGGYENENGDIVIDEFFDEVSEFSENGRAMVCEDSRWKMITLDMYR